MTNNPDQIKAEIEITRAELSRDVDALAESVRPGNVARRQKNKVTAAVSGAKDAVINRKNSMMGSAGQAQSGSGGVLHSTSESLSSTLSSTGETISSTPQMAKERAQGNPLAAGLIAMGAGWLVGSILPATRTERQAVGTLKERVASPLAQEVSGIAKESAQNLQQPAKEAVEQVKSKGIDAVETVKEEGTSTASDVAGTAKEGAQNVKQSSQSS
jgi:hypothetical protein